MAVQNDSAALAEQALASYVLESGWQMGSDEFLPLVGQWMSRRST
jgi:hypothetical protein